MDRGCSISYKEGRLGLFACSMIPYQNTYEKLLKKILETIRLFGKAAGGKMNIQKSVFLINPNNNQLEKHTEEKI